MSYTARTSDPTLGKLLPPLTTWMQTVTHPSTHTVDSTIMLICKFAVPTEGHPYGTLFTHCFSLQKGGLYLFRQILGTHC